MLHIERALTKRMQTEGALQTIVSIAVMIDIIIIIVTVIGV